MCRVSGSIVVLNYFLVEIIFGSLVGAPVITAIDCQAYTYRYFP